MLRCVTFVSMKEDTRVRSIRFPKTLMEDIESQAKEYEKSFNRHLQDLAIEGLSSRVVKKYLAKHKKK